MNRIAWLVILVLLALAYLNVFIQDDAFISFRYASNLVSGHGLTWNPGEDPPIEGYTNFLWTVILALPMSMGIDPVVASTFLGLLCAFGSFYFMFRLALLVFASPTWALLTLILLGTNYSFSAYATGGLETQLQAFLIVASTYLALRMLKEDGVRPFAFFGLSLLFALALLTRLDSVIPLAVPGLYISRALYKRHTFTEHRLIATALLVLPALLIIAAWHVWKVSYYGELLPNTYYAKASRPSLGLLRSGLIYIYAFFQSYFLIPFFFIFVVYFKRLVQNVQLRVCLYVTFLWFLYVMVVGGDFMEFRMFVPVLPIVFILIVSMIRRLSNRPLRIAFVAMVLVGSLHHAVTFRGVSGVESIRQLSAHIVDEEQNWDEVGAAFNTMFLPSRNPVTIATTAAGAIPFYSELPTVDMLGPNDRWIARNGPMVGARPGHQRRPTLAYLVGRGVNLVLGHPQVISVDTDSRRYSAGDLYRFYIEDIESELLPADCAVIEIPVNSKYKITVLYLVSHDDVDRLIEDRALTVYDVRRRD